MAPVKLKLEAKGEGMTEHTIWITAGKVFLLGGDDPHGCVGPLALIGADGKDMAAQLSDGTYNRDGGPGLSDTIDGPFSD
ncbi:MAG: hypothetical protein PF480_02885 [Roseovarius sp.]|jgi:hypothetical protein|nr:hypothetical protein [Roseovarius sp.]